MVATKVVFMLVLRIHQDDVDTDVEKIIVDTDVDSTVLGILIPIIIPSLATNVHDGINVHA